MKIREKLKPFANKIIPVLDKIILPGFDGIPLYKILVFFVTKLKQVALTGSAS